MQKSSLSQLQDSVTVTSSDRVEFNGISFGLEEVLFDAQTSGGLLVSLKKEDAYKAIEEIKTLGLKCGIIGEITELKDKLITIKR